MTKTISIINKFYSPIIILPQYYRPYSSANQPKPNHLSSLLGQINETEQFLIFHQIVKVPILLLLLDNSDFNDGLPITVKLIEKSRKRILEA
jgi:hypothetical protein